MGRAVIEALGGEYLAKRVAFEGCRYRNQR